MYKTATLGIPFFTTTLIALCLSTEKIFNIIDSGVSLKENEAIVKKHNYCRLQVAQGSIPKQPKACRNHINKLVWDEKIALKAQELADTGVFNHVTVTDGRWYHVGQNLGLEWSSLEEKGSNWNGTIDKWFDENVEYVYPQNPDHNTGHYTQVVWNETIYIGCGYTHFINESGLFHKLYVCHYGPGGNKRGSVPYNSDKNGCENS